MNGPLNVRESRVRRWADPLSVAAGLNRRNGALALVSDGGALGRWSYVAADPDLTWLGSVGEGLGLLRGPFATGSAGLLSYDAGARVATGDRTKVWPDMMLARYPAMLAFDHAAGEVHAAGRGENAASAAAAADLAESWLLGASAPPDPPPPMSNLVAERGPDDYAGAVADVVDRIRAGELFQANIARAWSGRLRQGADPFDVMLRLGARASAYGAFWRLGDRAIVSNSPELFLAFDPGSGRIETRPIKGTRRRDGDPARDAALVADLRDSAKDRAENLMIVDLMRNDLSRVSVPGSVVVERLFEVERLPTVHHLVSTVTAMARPGIGPAELLGETFPPGSITGAPKHQAMKVIAAHEAPRGPWCGSLFHIGDDGRMASSVLIRTASFQQDSDGWTCRALAGAGIVADSDPASELAETDAKMRALKEALTGA